MISPWYAIVFKDFERIAWRHGYAIAIHGSMQRDLDLVAIPWVEDADPKEKLIESLRKYIGGKNVDCKIGQPIEKPHGRLAYAITIGFSGNMYVDFSIMPMEVTNG